MSKLEDTARRIRLAYSNQTIAPLRDTLEPDNVDDAYQIQQINTDYWLAKGHKIIGRKIGLTSPVVQAQLGVDQPDFGVLFENMQIPNDGKLSSKELIQPKAEAEIAIVLGSDIDNTECTEEQFLNASDYAVTAIEIVDSRIEDWKITFADTVADNGSAARFVLGSVKHSLIDLDLYTCGMVLEVDGKITSMGTGAACLGHPLKAGAWLARTLAAKQVPLRAGDIILTGALGPMVTLSAGQKIEAKIGGLGRCSFTYF